MKSIYSYALLGALFAVGAAKAATTTTIPVGYTSTTLVKGFNLLGVTLQQPILVSDTVSSVSNGTLTATSSTAFSGLTAGTTYIVEITGNGGVGFVTEATVTSPTVLATTDNLSAVGVTNTSTFQVRKAATLEDLFGTTTTVLTKATVAGSTANADIVWVPTATPGSYNKYFLSSAGAWKSAADNTNKPNTPVVYLDGVFVQHQAATSVTLTLTGEVKKVATQEALVTGFNLISTVYPVGVTLQNSGLAATVAKATVAGSTAKADIIWVPAATPGTYTKYYLSSAGAWKAAADNSTLTADLLLTTGIFIQHQATTALSINLTPPAAYTSL